jgi:hypothetical protein
VGTVASPTLLSSGNLQGGIYWNVYRDSGHPSPEAKGTASIAAYATANHVADANYETNLMFETIAPGSTSAVTSLILQGNNITLNGLSYIFPSSQTANYYLQTDGSGNLSWAAGGGAVTYPLLAPNGNCVCAKLFFFC